MVTNGEPGSVSLSGTFVRDNGEALPSSVSVFFYIENAAQPDDFVRGQETLNPSTGEFSAVLTNIPVRVTRLLLSFVITDPAEARDDRTDAGPGSVFSLFVANCDYLPPVIALEWSDATIDLDLSVVEPGGKVVIADKENGVIEGVSADDGAWTRLVSAGYHSPRR